MARPGGPPSFPGAVRGPQTIRA
ncbi:protein of unknown function [Azospirillum baldaniorum]|uniref:Uncharacterized protein n=1 Tax=Azospirillum baldaniorum TaxID=1064539 RepID=A0A9P1JPP5_9PROT|nr:protein of unknown function [Azospirillum baldaniorum]